MALPFRQYCVINFGLSRLYFSPWIGSFFVKRCVLGLIRLLFRGIFSLAVDSRVLG
jgi:hypothetical protein